MRFFGFQIWIQRARGSLTIFDVESAVDTFNRVRAAGDGLNEEDCGAESVDTRFGKVDLAILQTMSTLSLRHQKGGRNNLRYGKRGV